MLAGNVYLFVTHVFIFNVNYMIIISKNVFIHLKMSKYLYIFIFNHINTISIINLWL